MKCQNCVYFDQFYENSGGRCRRKPPSIAINDDGETVSVWPPVDLDEWCGEFEFYHGLTEQKTIKNDPKLTIIDSRV